MSKGKYSPTLTRAMIANDDYRYNADKQIAPDFIKGQVFDERLHDGSYDHEGFDRYGYSAFLADGTFIGTGQGIDRAGYTEDEYLSMSNDDFNRL